jgi:hypothetical protein
MMLQCTRSIRSAILPALAILLSACATGDLGTASTRGGVPYPPPGYAHTSGSSPLVLYWNCTRGDSGVIRLEGHAFNPWSSQPIRYLEFDLVGVDERERSVSEATMEARDLQLFTNQSTPIALEVRPVGGEQRFDLYYRYRFQDGGRDNFLAGAGSTFPILATRLNQFRIRDACSDAQHRAR